ncbi:hypothetical protein KKG31_06090 [Patescibacteria group bacterium]|nr:hypothetical protein [Patescibacteria group bacterium]
MYQIRDSNRNRRAGKKEECWLKIDPLNDEDTEGCGDDPRMGSGYYILTTTSTS